MRTILGSPTAPPTKVISTLPLSADECTTFRGGAHWASWADRIHEERHPAIAEMITHFRGGTAPCFQAVRESLEGAGLNILSWGELAESP